MSVRHAVYVIDAALVQAAHAEQLDLSQLRSLTPVAIFEECDGSPDDLSRRAVAALPTEAEHICVRTWGPDNDIWAFSSFGDSRAVVFCPVERARELGITLQE